MIQLGSLHRSKFCEPRTSVDEQFKEEQKLMSVEVLDRNSRVAGLSATFRKPVGGPECELVDWFLQQDIVNVPRGCRVTVFREPRLESGFPDLVVVIWNERVANKWNKERALLSPADIRILHYLAQQGPKSEVELSAIFSNRLHDRLRRLELAGSIRSTKNLWHACSLAKNYAVRRIVAVEAKLSRWSEVLEQAHLNTWFASESYVLIPQLPRSEVFSESARMHGIGIWTKDEGRVRPARKGCGHLPLSYASWLFNEWVWQAARFH